jgi:hypothetical protein
LLYIRPTSFLNLGTAFPRNWLLVIKILVFIAAAFLVDHLFQKLIFQVDLLQIVFLRAGEDNPCPIEIFIQKNGLVPRFLIHISRPE